MKYIYCISGLIYMCLLYFCCYILVLFVKTRMYKDISSHCMKPIRIVEIQKDICLL